MTAGTCSQSAKLAVAASEELSAWHAAPHVACFCLLTVTLQLGPVSQNIALCGLCQIVLCSVECVCVCVCMCAWGWGLGLWRACVRECERACVRVCVCAYTCERACVRVCAYTCERACVCACLHV